MARLEAQTPFASLARPLVAKWQNCMVPGALPQPGAQRPQSEEGGCVLRSDDHRSACLKRERSRSLSQMGEHLSQVFQSEEPSVLFC